MHHAVANSVWKGSISELKKAKPLENHGKNSSEFTYSRLSLKRENPRIRKRQARYGDLKKQRRTDSFIKLGSGNAWE